MGDLCSPQSTPGQRPGCTGGRRVALEAVFEGEAGNRPELPILADGIVELLLLGIKVRLQSRYERRVLRSQRRGRRAAVYEAEIEGDCPARLAEVRAVVAEPEIGCDGVRRLDGRRDGPGRCQKVRRSVEIDGCAARTGAPGHVEIVIAAAGAET